MSHTPPTTPRPSPTHHNNVIQVLSGIADTTAQTLTAFRRRQAQRAADPERGGSPKDDFFSIEIADLADDKKVPWPEYRTTKPPPFDFERTVRFMSYAFLMSPLQHWWFGRLAKWFPLQGGAGATLSALKRVAFDQLLFAPCGLACFFTFMTVAEGGGKRAVARKFQDVYIPALKANYIVWPAVQILNFRVMPIQFQIVSIEEGLTITEMLIFVRSHLCPRLGLRGRPTCRLRTRRKMRALFWIPLSEETSIDCSKGGFYLHSVAPVTSFG